MTRFLDPAGAAALVADGDRIGVGGCLFSRLPMALVRAVADSGVANLTYASWGGGLPLEVLLEAGCVSGLVFCFSSLDVLGQAPRFREAMESGTLTVEELPALAMVQGYQARRHRLPSMPFRVPAGSDVLTRTSFTRLFSDPVSGERLGATRALERDVLLMHAQRADEDGNVEIEGALGQDRLGPYAAERVIVSVEEIVARGELARCRRGTVIPKEFVSAVVHAPLGAYPTSCLPFYATDYREISRLPGRRPSATEPDPERVGTARRAAAVRHPDVLATNGRVRADLGGECTSAEQLVVTLARSYRDGDIVSAGAVSPIALASYLLAKATHAPGLTIITTSGGYIDIAERPMLLGLGEVLDFQTAVAHASGDDTYHDYYQPGRISYEVVGAAQVDRHGRVNTTEVRSPSGRLIRLPGQGGMADVADMHQNFVVYLPRHSPLALVDEVHVVSASRSLLTDDERLAAGLRPGVVKVVTNLAVFEVDHQTRLLTVTGLQPGVDLEEVRAQTGFPLMVAPEPVRIAPPDPSELRALRERVDPLGISRLELVPARDRARLLEEIFDAEEDWVGELAGAPAG